MLGELEIYDYNPVIHIKHIYDWFKLRKMDLQLINELPKVGSIVLYKDTGIAAGFLRMVEPHYAMLDGLITNPEALSHLRNDAIDDCVESLIIKAKVLKLKSLLAHTVIPGIIKRSKKHGFEQLPDNLIFLNL